MIIAMMHWGFSTLGGLGQVLDGTLLVFICFHR